MKNSNVMKSNIAQVNQETGLGLGGAGVGMGWVEAGWGWGRVEL